MIAAMVAAFLLHAEVLSGWRDFCQQATWNPTDYDHCLSEGPQLRTGKTGDWIIDLSFLLPNPEGRHAIYAYAKLPHALGF